MHYSCTLILACYLLSCLISPHAQNPDLSLSPWPCVYRLTMTIGLKRIIISLSFVAFADGFWTNLFSFLVVFQKRTRFVAMPDEIIAWQNFLKIWSVMNESINIYINILEEACWFQPEPEPEKTGAAEPDLLRSFSLGRRRRRSRRRFPVSFHTIDMEYFFFFSIFHDVFR